MKRFKYLQPSLSFLFVFEIVSQYTWTRMPPSKLCAEIDYSKKVLSFRKLVCSVKHGYGKQIVLGQFY